MSYRRVKVTLERGLGCIISIVALEILWPVVHVTEDRWRNLGNAVIVVCDAVVLVVRERGARVSGPGCITIARLAKRKRLGNIEPQVGKRCGGNGSDPSTQRVSGHDEAPAVLTYFKALQGRSNRLGDGVIRCLEPVVNLRSLRFSPLV